MTSILTELNMLVQCEGRYVRGEKMRFDKSFGQYLPEEQSELKEFRVYIIKPRTDSKAPDHRLDITDYLAEDEFAQLYNECLQAEAEEEDNG